MLRQAERFEGGARRREVVARPYDPAEVVEVFRLVNVEGRRRPSHGEIRASGLCDYLVQDRPGAHRDAAEYVVVVGGSTQSDQVVPAVVDGAEDEVMTVELAEGFTDGFGFEVRRVGGDQDDSLLAPVRRPREEPSLPFAPVSLSLQEDAGPASVADDQRSYLRPRAGRGYVPARSEGRVLEADREVLEEGSVEFDGGLVSDGASQAGLRFARTGCLGGDVECVSQGCSGSRAISRSLSGGTQRE